MASVTWERVLFASDPLNTVCVNANGLRAKRKRILLGKLLFDLQAAVGIVTGTHLRRADVNGLHFRNYNKPANYCRPTDVGRRIGGGRFDISAHALTATCDNV